MASEPFYDSHKVYEATTSWHDGDGWTEGRYICPLGLVEIYMQTVDGEHTSLRFIANGRFHYKSWDRAFTKRGCSRLAGQFAREVVER